MTSTPEQSPEAFRQLAQQKAVCLARIEDLERRASHAFWALTLFLAVSVVFGFGLDRLPSMSPEFREWLGAAPPVNLIHAALLVYSFSALILIFSRMTLDQPPQTGFMHVAYLTVFYLFYHLAGEGSDNFWAVLAAGAMILGLATYRQRNYCAENLRGERETLQVLERREKFLGIGAREPEGG